MGLFDFIKSAFQIHDLDTLEGIQSIPNKQNILQYAQNGSLSGSILADLQKKATEHKKNGKMDLSIACLEKSFDIMLNSDYYWAPYADRYVKYLKNDRQFDKAREVEKLIAKHEKNSSSDIEEYIVNARKLKIDLVEATYPSPCDEETAKYRGRVFSISGKDKRFPVLSKKIKKCDLEFYPFVYGASVPNYCPEGKEIEFSNRPFVDDRSKKEITAYNKSVKEYSLHQNDESEYYWLYENLPDIAPKSLSGYVRMKNSNSKNFQNLVAQAKEHGYTIKTQAK